MIDLHSIPYYRILILISCPFVYCFLLAIFWILYKFRSKQDVFENFLITTSITFFYFQSSIINALADLLSCTKIEKDFYLTNYLLENCGENSKYEHWRNILIIPTFCFFSVILTIIPFVYICKNMKTLYSHKMLRKVGFLLNGYSPRYFYW